MAKLRLTSLSAEMAGVYPDLVFVRSLRCAGDVEPQWLRSTCYIPTEYLRDLQVVEGQRRLVDDA